MKEDISLPERSNHTITKGDVLTELTAYEAYILVTLFDSLDQESMTELQKYHFKLSYGVYESLRARLTKRDGIVISNKSRELSKRIKHLTSIIDQTIKDLESMNTEPARVLIDHIKSELEV